MPPAVFTDPAGALRGLRYAADDDGPALLELVGQCYVEYPRCVLDPTGVDADLAAPASAFSRKGGALWLIERGAAIVACIGWAPAPWEWEGLPGVELKRLYVDASARRQGVGAALARMIEAVALSRGDAFVDLWSDTRFHDAHRLYQRLGYSQLPERRALGDPSDTVERHFVRRLGTVPPPHETTPPPHL